MASVSRRRKDRIHLSCVVNLPMLLKFGDLASSKRLLPWKEYNDVRPSLSSMTFSQPTSTAYYLPSNDGIRAA